MLQQTLLLPTRNERAPVLVTLAQLLHTRSESSLRVLKFGELLQLKKQGGCRVIILGAMFLHKRLDLLPDLSLTRGEGLHISNVFLPFRFRLAALLGLRQRFRRLTQFANGALLRLRGGSPFGE
jgi:hypothetical protein